MPTVTSSAPPAWHPELEREYAELGARLEPLLPCLEWPLHLPWIDAINRLKRERGAVIMAHSYQSPEIFHGVADVTGDSLALAQAAAQCDAGLIVLCGVHFMAETAKILNPDKIVVVPDLTAGCSLADGCPAPLFAKWLEKYPGHTVVSYINCGADVGAPVTPKYKPPFPLTGKIYKVTVDVSGELIRDREAELRRHLARQ